MKILIDKIPQIPQDCLFSYRNIEYSYRFCRFGGMCKDTKSCEFLMETIEIKKKEERKEE